MEDYAEQINIDDLYIRKHQIEEVKLKVFRKILNRAHNKIKITSRQRHRVQFTFFVIPEFLVGTPTYDVAACTAFLIDKLTTNGFFVKYTHPNLLFISWAHYLDKKQRMYIKKIYGVNVDGNGNIVKTTASQANKSRHRTQGDINSLIIKAPTVNVKAKREYKSISTYKPTGNLIYNNELLHKIENRTRS